MEDAQRLKESLLEVRVNAALTGHDLAGFEIVTDRISGGYEARCRSCGRTAWVGENGLIYSLLDETCSRSGNTSNA